MSHTDKHAIGATAHHEADTLANLNALISDLIATYGGLRDIGIGPLSVMPAPGTAKRLWFATDDLTLYEDDGETWNGTNTWQKTIVTFANDAPVGLTQADSGKRWVVGTNPTPGNIFENHENEIATYFDDGLVASWTFFLPDSGTFVCLEGETNSVYEYYRPEGPPVGDARQEGWLLRGDQNVGTTGTPEFNGATVTSAPLHLSQYLIRREELRQYDFQGAVLSTSATEEPPAPNPGDRHIVFDGAGIDPWGPTNHNKIAVWEDSAGPLIGEAWKFYTPQEGWMVWDHESNQFLAYYAGSWWFQGNVFTHNSKTLLGLSQAPPDFQYAARMQDLYEGVFGHSVVDSTIADAPGVPAVGSKYLVAAGSTPGDEWETHTGEIAVWVDGYNPPNYQLTSLVSGAIPGAWKYVQPFAGMIVYDKTNDLYLEYVGASWVSHAPEPHAASHTDGTDDIQDASAVQKGLVNIIAQAFAGRKEFVDGIRITDLNTGQEILITDTNGDVQESGVKVTTAPAGGSGFTVVEYATAPVNPPAGFFWMQAKDANTKTFNYYDGVQTYSVDLSV